MGQRPHARRERRRHSDDTAAIQEGDRRASRALFSQRPLRGHATRLRSRPDTVLIGLHPTLTQFDLARRDARLSRRRRTQARDPRAGRRHNILSGIGVFTGGINPRAVAVLWKAGEHRSSMMCASSAATAAAPTPTTITTPPTPICASAGTASIQACGSPTAAEALSPISGRPNTFAQAGFVVSNTKTPGHVYELSNEHHVRNEIKFDHVENWDINAPQTEEEAGESPESLSLEIDFSTQPHHSPTTTPIASRVRARRFPPLSASITHRTFISATCT